MTSSDYIQPEGTRMDQEEPRASFRLLKEFVPAGRTDGTELSDLREQLGDVPGFEGVELAPDGASTVVASVPTRNKRQTDMLRQTLGRCVRGWKVIDDASYRLPATF